MFEGILKENDYRRGHWCIYHPQTGRSEEIKSLEAKVDVLFEGKWHRLTWHKKRVIDGYYHDGYPSILVPKLNGEYLSEALPARLRGEEIEVFGRCKQPSKGVWVLKEESNREHPLSSKSIVDVALGRDGGPAWERVKWRVNEDGDLQGNFKENAPARLTTIEPD